MGILKQYCYIFWAAAAIVGTNAAHAEIFKYEDIEGRVHFTDRPIKQRGFRLTWRSGPEPGSRPALASQFNPALFKRNKARYTPLINAAAVRTSLRPELLHAVVLAESAYDPNARSHKGAMGLMQLMPETAERYGVYNAWDPKANLEAGARYLRDLLQLFRNDLRLALAAYNAGENAVKKYGNRVPPYPETRRYVQKVIGYLNENRQATDS